MTSTASTTLAIEWFLRFLSLDDRPPSWPPDVFAVSLRILELSGAYTKAVGDWPPYDPLDSRNRKEQAEDWAERMKNVGETWRTLALSKSAPPREIIERWEILINASRRGVLISEVTQNRHVCSALLELCAAADEACYGVGLPADKGESLDVFNVDAWTLIRKRGTLCERIDGSLLRVLPKLHTPQIGMTSRSLSHNLALVEASDVRPHWHVVQSSLPMSLNILLVPWPMAIRPNQFVKADGQIENMDDQFGFFTFTLLRQQKTVLDRLTRLYENAKAQAGNIEGVIFPELALADEEFESVRKEIVEKRRAFLIAGTGTPASGRDFGNNCVRFDFPLDAAPLGIEPQHKHHRWRLERPQILQYGLQSSLSPDRKWWECIDIGERCLTFVALSPWLTVCVLICEDLARQDPVAQIVRAVGPNLVVALLMDGPQLTGRWSARYATVLAEDPGSSVLTLTNAGMVDLCRGPQRFLDSRCVALWKDAVSGGPYEINLPANAEGLVLSLDIQREEEWTADGRRDYGATGRPVLAGVYPVTVSGD